MRRVAFLAFLQLCVPASQAVADVTPYPVWRLSSDSGITAAAQAGARVFVGGPFSRLGQALQPFEGFFDPATLQRVAPPGCATDSGRPIEPAPSGMVTLVSGGLAPLGSRLADDRGPFVVGPDVSHVRLGADCRFVRTFAARLPPGIALDWSAFDDGRGRLYVASAFPIAGGSYYVGALDSHTGALIDMWPVPSRTSIVGARPDGRLSVVLPSSSSLGVLDPITGQVSIERQLPGSSFSARPVGSSVLLERWETVRARPRLELYDHVTWQLRPAWPEVTVATLALSGPVHAGTAIIVAAAAMTIGGGPTRSLAAFDATTGAHLQGWNASAWTDGVTVSQMTVAGSRLVIQGTFPSSAPVDSVAAFDVATGAAVPWAFPYVATRAVSLGGTLYLGRIIATARTVRDRLAAVDAATGALLPWGPSPALPASQPVSALVVRDGFLYVALGSTVRRYAVETGVRDENWRLDVTGSLAAVTQLAAGPTTLYATGSFVEASAGGGVPQARDAGAAITYAGALTTWNPPVRGTCTSVRPVLPTPCITRLVAAQDLVFLRGTIFPTDTALAARALAIVTPDTGTLLPATASVSSIANDGDVVYAEARPSALGPSSLVRVDPGLQVRSLVDIPLYGSLAARGGLVYESVERDGVSGAATGNAMHWVAPVALGSGIVDRSFGWALHPDIAATAPSAPWGLGRFGSASSLVLRWGRGFTDIQPDNPTYPAGATAATSHVIEASLTSGGPVVATFDSGSSDTEYAIQAPPGTFYIRVRAKNRFGTSAPSNEIRVDVTPAAPDAPVATVASVTAGTVRIAWQAPPGGWPALGYRVEAGRTSGATDIGVIPVSGTELVVPGVPPGRYFVRVRAVNAQGVSAAGTEVVFDVP